MELYPKILITRLWIIHVFYKYKKKAIASVMWNIIEHTRYNFMKIYLWRRIVPFISYIYMFVYYSTHLCNFKFLTNILNFPRKSIKRDFILITRAGNWLRTITSDQTPYTIIRRFLFELVGVISLDRHYWEVINLLFVLPILFYLSISKTEKIWQFWNKKFRKILNNVCITNDETIRRIILRILLHLSRKYWNILA